LRPGTAECGSGPSPSETQRRPLLTRMEALPHVQRLDRYRLGPAMANAIDGDTLFMGGTEVKLFGIDSVEGGQ